MMNVVCIFTKKLKQLKELLNDYDKAGTGKKKAKMHGTKIGDERLNEQKSWRVRSDKKCL